MLKRIVLLAALATPFVVSSIARADDDAKPAKPAKKAKKAKKAKAGDAAKTPAPAADDTAKKADAPPATP